MCLDDLRPLVGGEAELVRRGLQSVGDRPGRRRQHDAALNIAPRHLALLGGQHRADGLQLVLDELAMLGALLPILLREGPERCADLRALLVGEAELVGRRLEPIRHRVAQAGDFRPLALRGALLDHHGPLLDGVLHLVALLGGEDGAEGLELLAAQGAAGVALVPVLLGVAGVDLADLLPLLGRQAQLVGRRLEPVRDRLAQLLEGGTQPSLPLVLGTGDPPREHRREGQSGHIPHSHLKASLVTTDTLGGSTIARNGGGAPPNRFETRTRFRRPRRGALGSPPAVARARSCQSSAPGSRS